MPEQWMSVAQAAAAMEVHPRTVERRIPAGKIETRRNTDGQVQVLVAMPDVEAAVSTDTLETVKELADRQVDIAAGSASALVRISQDQAVRTETQLVLARQDAGRYRREAHMAMGLVAAMLLFVIVAVGWCTHAITAAKADARLSGDRAVQAAQLARQSMIDRNEDRMHYDDAIVARAKAEGELTAYKTELSAMQTVVEQDRKRPATQPANLVQRVAELFVGD